MTAPDGASEHAVPADFAWSPSYDAHLAHLADTDEVPPDCDWPLLKTAIKYKIQRIVRDFPENPQPLLHPVARFNALQSTRLGQRGRRAAGVGDDAKNGSANAMAGNQGEGEAEATSSRMDASPSAAAAGLTSRFSPASTDDDTHDMDNADPSTTASTSASASASTSNATTAPPAVDADSSADTSTSSSNSSSSSISASAPLDPAAVGVTEADFSGFYPAKTQPPPSRGGSWGRKLTPAETQIEVGMVFSMLDDFDVSPPFTIQRLAELLLSPRRFVRSAPKFLSSLTRILAMTASHADFPPVSPGQPPAANGYLPPAGFEGARMQGPPSPSSEPLFSPIPFLQRPPPGAGSSMAADVPHLDLETPSAGQGGSGESANPNVADNASEDASAPTAPQPQPLSLQGVTEPAPPTSEETPAAATTAPSAPGPSAPSTGPGSSAPLGVPHGRVDELDAVHVVDAEANASSAATSASTSGSEEGLTPTPDSSATTTSTATHHMDGALHPLSSTTTAPAFSDALLLRHGGGGAGAGSAASTGDGSGKADASSSAPTPTPTTTTTPMDVDVDVDSDTRATNEDDGDEPEGRSHKRMRSEDFRVDEDAREGAKPGESEESGRAVEKEEVAAEVEAEAEASEAGSKTEEGQGGGAAGDGGGGKSDAQDQAQDTDGKAGAAQAQEQEQSEEAAS